MLATLRRWTTSSRQLAALFLMVLVPSASTLVWLGVALVEQDRRVWADRELNRRETAADIIVRSLRDKLAAAEAMAFGAGAIPDGVIVATMDSTRTIVRPLGSILWTRRSSLRTDGSTDPFSAAEIDEFRGNGDRSLGRYSTWSRSASPSLRAGALLRLARVRRVSGDIDAAIQHYRKLTSFNDVEFDGMPASLVARRAICELLDQQRNAVELRREAEALRAEFLSGRWMMDGSGWLLTSEDIERWTGRPLEIPAEHRALTIAVDWLWQQLQATIATTTMRVSEGRRILQADDIPVLVQWRQSSGGLDALFVPPSVIGRWAREAVPPALVPFDAVALTDELGVVVTGTKPESGSRVVTRLFTETGLPWNILLKPIVSAGDRAQLSSRRRLLASGLGAIVILLAGGSYLLWRTVRRELAVARIQAEFVAAVSHEFRTPLTSLQHVTELLEEDDELPRARRQSLYAAQARSTGRLRGLVESLLDFARMEEGRRPYDLQPVDASSLVERVVAEFQRHLVPRHAFITPELPPRGRVQCRADADALGHALWNLLDNAVKYSPEPSRVRVSVSSDGTSVLIAVADQGFGIPAHERDSVFDRFVRGGNILKRGISGTGLGLAIVRHIVSAHQGRVELESTEGRGSTFTIVLPAERDAPCLAS